MKLDRITRSLSACNLDHWMLVFRQFRLNTDLRKFTTDLKRSLKDDIVKIVVRKDVGKHLVVKLVISNPGCAICGWSERWLMNL